VPGNVDKKEMLIVMKRILSLRLATTAVALLFLMMLSCMDGVATSAPELNSNPDNEKDSAKPPSPDVAPPAGQIKDLQKQVAELQTRVNELQKPRIIAAGTATFNLGEEQDNATRTRVQLSGEVATRLGDDYIVLLTTRFPAGGYPFFVPYWKRAKDGFDVTLVDVTLGPNATASYANRNKAYLIDWIVVKK
jgi:TolA-binding protein